MVHTRYTKITRTLFAALALIFAGCPENGLNPQTQNEYIISQLALGSDEAGVTRMDVDRDPSRRTENSVGEALNVLVNAFGEYIRQPAFLANQPLLDSGELTHLLRLRTNYQAPADVVGEIDYLVNGVLQIIGEPIRHFGNSLYTGPSSSAVLFETALFSDEIFELPIENLRIEGELYDGDLLSGKIGGTINTAALTPILLKEIAWYFEMLRASLCNEGLCGAGSIWEGITALYDTNGNGTISEVELLNSPLASTIAYPDLDMNGDGVKESHSIVFGFSTTVAPATAE